MALMVPVPGLGVLHRKATQSFMSLALFTAGSVAAAGITIMCARALTGVMKREAPILAEASQSRLRELRELWPKPSGERAAIAYAANRSKAWEARKQLLVGTIR
ncbi:hypothetical protein CYMTET_37691 [Cymbomonas tetramitiformis]|uniref:Uncharacterized protein n=1 Tax=Cymbomonas tetramitiformis TaxID=36881 RepID=A0AAE0CF68_9CHLO|nr:hypothetical protein CYMTET_37691 [Cymbomonas tetramitiformis]